MTGVLTRRREDTKGPTQREEGSVKTEAETEVTNDSRILLVKGSRICHPEIGFFSRRIVLS